MYACIWIWIISAFGSGSILPSDLDPRCLTPHSLLPAHPRASAPPLRDTRPCRRVGLFGQAPPGPRNRRYSPRPPRSPCPPPTGSSPTSQPPWRPCAAATAFSSSLPLPSTSQPPWRPCRRLVHGKHLLERLLHLGPRVDLGQGVLPQSVSQAQGDDAVDVLGGHLGGEGGGDEGWVGGWRCWYGGVSSDRGVSSTVG